MKTINPFYRFLMVFLLVSKSVYAGGNRCGGDGPRPLTDLPSFASKIQKIVDNDLVKEFLFLERHDSLIYRNLFREIRRIDLHGMRAEAVGVSSDLPLSPLVDEQERYILTDGAPFFHSLFNPFSWMHFSGPEGRIQHLFWEGGRLYSLAMNDDRFGSRHFEVFRYRPWRARAVRVCAFTTPAGTDFHLAKGHSFPNVFLYTLENTQDGPRLNFHKWNVETCRIDSQLLDFDLEGDVEEVIRYEGVGATAIKVDNSYRNLIWSKPESCQFYDVENLYPMPINSKIPVLATWSDKGVTLNFLEAEKKATFLQGVPLQSPTERDLWLANDGHRLFFAPQINGDRNHRLWEITMDGLPY